MGRKARVALRALLGAGGLLLLTSCGVQDLTGGGFNKPNPPGMFTDQTLVEYLQAGFDEAQACSDLARGSFDDLTVVMMEPQFACRWYESGCSGEFVTPNTIKLGSPYVWKHEVLHYLLYVNTGDADSNHASELFWDCV
jgi:hypothetical protein